MTGPPILVGVDGSDCSLVAVDLAVREAALRGRPVRIVYCDPWADHPAWAHNDPAIVSARQALAPVRDAYGTQKLFAAPKEKAPRQRSIDERWAFMVENRSSAMSGAGYKDEVTKDFECTREDAELLIVSTVGMLKRLSTASNAL